MINKLSIIIPVYNESSTLRTLLELVDRSEIPYPKELIIVDAGSSDSSRSIIENFRPQSEIKTLFFDKRCGKGRAVREGLKLASGDIYLIQDADLEYSPLEYAKLLEPLENSNVDFVLGSRALKLGSNLFRFKLRPLPGLLVLDLGGMALKILFNLLHSVQMSDPLSMFKVIRRGQLSPHELTSDGFEIDLEILSKLVKKGRRFVEIPVAYNPRTKSEGKKLIAWKDGLRSIWTIFTEYFTASTAPPNEISSH